MLIVKCEVLTVNCEFCIEACHCHRHRTFLEAFYHLVGRFLERLQANGTCLGSV